MNDFNKKKYKLVKNCIQGKVLKLSADYFEIQKLKPGYYEEDPNVSHAVFRYADALTESMLILLKPVFEKETGLELYPTYSFLRYYRKGAELEPHKDRPSCEISGTLVINFQADYLWPICLALNGNDIEIAMDKGDLLIYRGMELQHWRKKFTGESWVQIFLHYVDADGDYTEFKKDKRPHIGYELNDSKALDQ